MSKYEKSVNYLNLFGLGRSYVKKKLRKVVDCQRQINILGL